LGWAEPRGRARRRAALRAGRERARQGGPHRAAIDAGEAAAHRRVPAPFRMPGAVDQGMVGPPDDRRRGGRRRRRRRLRRPAGLRDLGEGPLRALLRRPVWRTVRRRVRDPGGGRAVRRPGGARVSAARPGLVQGPRIARTPSSCTAPPLPPSVTYRSYDAAKVPAAKYPTDCKAPRSTPFRKTFAQPVTIIA